MDTVSKHRAIAESELIINERGAIYHLNIRPEELADTIITVGDPDRVRVISSRFDVVEHQLQHREFVTHTGVYKGRRISVVSTGIGTDNIDIVMNELDAVVNIDFNTRTIKHPLRSLDIIRVGTAGSLQPDIPVDAFVASTHGIGIDNLLHFYPHQVNEEERQLQHAFVTHTQLQDPFPRPYIMGGSPALLKHFTGDFHHGLTVTCPGFYGPQGRVLRLGLTQPRLNDLLTGFAFGNHRITNFEMETSAIYGLGRLLGHRTLSLSAIVANRVAGTFSKDASATVEALITATLEILAGAGPVPLPEK